MTTNLLHNAQHAGNGKSVISKVSLKPFDAHSCHTGTAIKHPVPYWVKPSFVIFDIRAL